MSKQRQNSGNPFFYVICSAAGILLALMILVFMTVWGHQLREIGTLGSTYYILLFPLALGAASFLFGALKSYALYKGKHLGGVLEIGGPAVVVGLIVIGGFILAPTEKFIVVTIRMHGPSGPNEVIKEGVVQLDLGHDRREAPLASNGEVTFKEVPDKFLGKQAVIILDSYGFLLSKENQRVLITREPIYVAAAHRPNVEPIRLQIAISIIQKGRHILMARRRLNEGTFSWGFIGGIIKPNEESTQRAIDEPLKETGVTVKIVKRLGERVTPETRVSATYFHCEYLSGEARNLEPEENSEVKWVDIDDVERYVTSSVFIGVKDLLNEIRAKN